MSETIAAAASTTHYISTNFTFYRCVAGAVRDKGWANIDRLAIAEKDGRFRNSATFANKVPHNVEYSFQVVDVERRSFTNSALSSLLSDNFMARLICGHFHLTLKEPGKVLIDGLPFEIPTDCGDNSIAGIECTVFRNGYVALVIRMRPLVRMRDSQLLEFIQRPDQIVKPSGYGDGNAHPFSSFIENSVHHKRQMAKENWTDAGILGVVAYWIAEDVYRVIDAELGDRRFEFADYGTSWMKWNAFKAADAANREGDTFRKPINGRIGDPWGKWSRPYVGVHFTSDQVELAKPGDVDYLKTFIIAAGRTTPYFLGKFLKPGEYLDSDRRNVYGDGGSIVFIAARGWSVWESGNQGAISFHIGVVEMSHFTIMAIDCGLRARRRFHQFVVEDGAHTIRDFNSQLATVNLRGTIFGAIAALLKLIRIRSGREPLYLTLRALSRRTTRFMGRAYSGAPFDDGVSILESHLKSHTARRAAVRFKELKFFNETHSRIIETLRHYDAALSHSVRYFQMFTQRLQLISVLLAIFGSVIAIRALFGK